MIYLSGFAGREVREIRRPDFGYMLQPGTGNRVDLDGIAWAADNGCFSARRPFDEGRWLRWLARMRPNIGTCLFAVAPDVWSDWPATWARSRPYFAQIRKLGYRPACAIQDGAPLAVLDSVEFDAVLVGGTDAYRASEACYQLVARASAQGRWTHLGRVNTWKWLNTAAGGGFDSADGTLLAFGPTARLPDLLRWLDRLEGAAHLPLVGS